MSRTKQNLFCFPPFSCVFHFGLFLSLVWAAQLSRQDHGNAVSFGNSQYFGGARLKLHYFSLEKAVSLLKIVPCWLDLLMLHLQGAVLAAKAIRLSGVFCLAF